MEKSGVHKLPVGDEFVYFYSQSSLVSYNGNLYCPDYFDGNDSVGFMKKAIKTLYEVNKKLNLIFMPYCGLHQRCQKVRLIIIRNVDEGGLGFFCQNHLIDHSVTKAPTINNRLFYRGNYQGHEIPRVISCHVWSRFILNQDQITKRIVRIQRFLKSLVLLKRQERLHVLAGFTIGNKKLIFDVISIIASML